MRKLYLLVICALLPAFLSAQEICDNGIDDDGDGLIDLNDSDCRCAGIGIVTGVTSLIPNPSFEDTLCCPTSFSQLDCAVSWIQASGATSDYFNTCNFTSISGFTPPFPLPGGGNGYAGFYDFPAYHEMIGACLNSTMKADTSYRFSFFLAKGSPVAPTLVVTIYGTPDCNDLPWEGEECPLGVGSWVLLGSDTVVFQDNSWHQVSIEFTPTEDIRALAIGGPCVGANGYIQNYYYIDELIVASSSQFDDKAGIVESGKWCTGDLQLRAEIDTPGGSWQWYRSGIALAGETDPVLSLMPYGTDFEYTAVYRLGGDCVAIKHTADTTDPANRPRGLSVRNQDTVVCEGAVIPVQATATPGYNYQWFPANGVSDPNVLEPDIRPEDTAVFYVLTASFPGCPDTAMGFHIRMQSIPVVDLGNDTLVCPGDFVPLTSVIHPYRPDYDYEWTPAAGLQFGHSSNNYFLADSNMTYALRVSTPIGCSGADSIDIEVAPGSFASAIPDTGYCPPGPVQLWAAGGTGYHWTPAYGLSESAVPEPFASPRTSTIYTVTVTSAIGCRDTAQVFVDVYPNAIVNLPDTITIYPGERYQLQVGTNAHYFTWFPTSGISNTQVSNPFFFPETRTRYFVTASTEHGCVVTDSVDIVVNQTVLDLPNAFHPGSRPFKIEKRGLAQLNHFVIYNRWGNKVFETTDINQGWDGTYNGAVQPVGVYVYRVDAVTLEGQPLIKEGNVTLIK